MGLASSGVRDKMREFHRDGEKVVSVAFPFAGVHGLRLVQPGERHESGNRGRTAPSPPGAVPGSPSNEVIVLVP